MVFMDHMMPEMDGVEATTEIRKLGGKYKHLAIVALTANAVKGAKEMFLENGFNDMVTKPIDLRELNRALEKWLPPEKIKRKPESETTAAEMTEAEILSDEEDAETARLLDALGKIDEINTEIGLDYVSGIKRLFFANVVLCHESLLTECEKITAFLNNEDLANFSISIHAMKSMLATIGAMSLSESALKLETASKEKDFNYCVQNFPELKEKLLSLHAQLSAIFPDEEVDSEKKPGDAAFLQTQIAKALSAAENFDGDAGIEAINSLLAYDFGDEINLALQNAMAAFKNFDFSGAVESLGKIRNEG
jgi:CheY-like chemotaxis protein